MLVRWRKRKEYTQTLIHSRHERVVKVMKVILKEVIHISPFVFVQVGFRNVSGEPRLIRPAERGTRDTTSLVGQTRDACRQSAGT
jgi:hypothetical protein